MAFNNSIPYFDSIEYTYKILVWQKAFSDMVSLTFNDKSFAKKNGPCPS